MTLYQSKEAFVKDKLSEIYKVDYQNPKLLLTGYFDSVINEVGLMAEHLIAHLVGYQEHEDKIDDVNRKRKEALLKLNQIKKTNLETFDLNAQELNRYFQEIIHSYCSSDKTDQDMDEIVEQLHQFNKILFQKYCFLFTIYQRENSQGANSFLRYSPINLICLDFYLNKEDFELFQDNWK